MSVKAAERESQRNLRPRCPGHSDTAPPLSPE
jgi:hypothetical protein